MVAVDDAESRFVLPHLRGRLRLFGAGDPPEGVLRLDLNEGPYGPTPSAWAALRGVEALNRYPDENAQRLRRRLAERHEVPVERVLPGPGSNGIASVLVRLTAGPGDRVVHSWPGFPTYPMAAARAGADAVAVPLRPDGSDDLEALLAAARGASILFLATPANPTGRRVGEELEEFVRAASRETLVVVDEAYAEYGPRARSAVDLVREGLPVVALRTFSKIWGLAGLRVGYAILPETLARHARALQDTFEISSASLAAAAGALDDEAEIERRREENERVRGALTAWLEEHGLRVLPSAANFVCAVVPGGDADGFARRTAAAGVLVRPLRAFGAPGWVRIGVPAEADLERALAALAAAAA